MGLKERLDHLVQSNQMVLHKPDVHEIQQHLLTAENLLADAKKSTNSLETRFNIGNSAGHHLLQAAVKINGYRPPKKDIDPFSTNCLMISFQALPAPKKPLPGPTTQETRQNTMVTPSM